MVLIGVIVGFAAERSSGMGRLARTTPTQGIQAPDAPTPPAPAPTPDPKIATNVVPVDFDRDHIRGSTKATIALIEYSDYQCPFCKRVHPTMQQLLKDYDGKILWVYRHYPLSFHEKAEPAAIAAECVNEIGGNAAFWKYTDAVFEQQETFDPAAVAAQIGINAAAFDRCVSGGTYKQYVADQLSQGSASGIQGTPGTIVLNFETRENRLVSGAQPIQSFKAAIDALLQ